MKDIRRKVETVTCKENLQKIAIGLKLYANEHEGKYPTGLSELIEGSYVEDEMVFNCPSNKELGDALEPDYHYTTGYSIYSPSDAIVVFDKEDNHKHGQHVLYVNGDIVWQKK